jgi:hypothetical protein
LGVAEMMGIEATRAVEAREGGLKETKPRRANQNQGDILWEIHDNIKDEE